jgi:hypothetical protein
MCVPLDRHELSGLFDSKAGEIECAIDISAHWLITPDISCILLRLHRIADDCEYRNAVLLGILTSYKRVIEPVTLRRLRVDIIILHVIRRW